MSTQAAVNCAYRVTWQTSDGDAANKVWIHDFATASPHGNIAIFVQTLKDIPGVFNVVSTLVAIYP